MVTPKSLFHTCQNIASTSEHVDDDCSLCKLDHAVFVCAMSPHQMALNIHTPLVQHDISLCVKTEFNQTLSDRAPPMI